MKTAFVLSIVAVATAAQDKIWPSVLRSIQQTSTESPNITAKPADTPTTTAETINPCPPNITPKPTTTAAAPITTSAAPTITKAAPSACDKPVDGVDYDGNDITSTQRSYSDDCCNDCAKTPDCVLYVWTNWNSGTCFLKSKAGKSILKWGAKAGKVTKPAKVFKPAGSCKAAQDNVDYNGNDIARISADKEDCWQQSSGFRGFGVSRNPEG
ncbi:hypothetical protein H257_03159 [Aphanomyces astaci]|uniref:Apple domain-containing protein n=1 Tax=Aphanomyces astaci TaxID=112090 RepID=W4H088_APHAT|nr:hypothetical protein H257_03159 [Aphanomyces astaci]ETV85420.1 hypothetical protein H257_03159 [Aphanomyces astaci]RQM24035.1 hypothetical protein B5M09_013959 [Aphanomyces astaci]|eukprot:XP_009825438.1 hypothetical protein H257_03159 [Aphanomyces astaci]